MKQPETPVETRSVEKVPVHQLVHGTRGRRQDHVIRPRQNQGAHAYCAPAARWIIERVILVSKHISLFLWQIIPIGTR